ncbi:glycosylation-dependent cell adhesion molecule 1-like [Nycticebus coucang]|uniref:glycosylation-dependent cell adhesion molecule 1-like n=1 Tax=Nycticebus coucang TaxID=9470 RepID=UPI00234DCA76|nr:glycosylation-dependent cell adhesion molecule 1-like [Nycticebus coucang]
MKFFTVLQLVSVVSTPLAILCPIHCYSQPRMNHVSNEDFSKETFISREELVSKEVVIKSTRQKSQTPELLHPVPQEDSFRNAELQLEETIELTPRAATTSEGKLAKLSRKIGKNLDKAMKELSGKPMVPMMS